MERFCIFHVSEQCFLEGKLDGFSMLNKRGITHSIATSIDNKTGMDFSSFPFYRLRSCEMIHHSQNSIAVTVVCNQSGRPWIRLYRLKFYQTLHEVPARSSSILLVNCFQTEITNISVTNNLVWIFFLKTFGFHRIQGNRLRRELHAPGSKLSPITKRGNFIFSTILTLNPGFVHNWCCDGAWRSCANNKHVYFFCIHDWIIYSKC